MAGKGAARPRARLGPVPARQDVPGWGLAASFGSTRCGPGRCPAHYGAGSAWGACTFTAAGRWATPTGKMPVPHKQNSPTGCRGHAVAGWKLVPQETSGAEPGRYASAGEAPAATAPGAGASGSDHGRSAAADWRSVSSG